LERLLVRARDAGALVVVRREDPHDEHGHDRQERAPREERAHRRVPQAPREVAVPTLHDRQALLERGLLAEERLGTLLDDRIVGAERARHGASNVPTTTALPWTSAPFASSIGTRAPPARARQSPTFTV